MAIIIFFNTKSSARLQAEDLGLRKEINIKTKDFRTDYLYLY